MFGRYRDDSARGSTYCVHELFASIDMPSPLLGIAQSKQWYTRSVILLNNHHRGDRIPVSRRWAVKAFFDNTFWGSTFPSSRAQSHNSIETSLVEMNCLQVVKRHQVTMTKVPELDLYSVRIRR